MKRKVVKSDVTLKSLVNRVQLYTKIAETHPEDKERIKRYINQQKEYIVQCVLQNANNELLERIVLR